MKLITNILIIANLVGVFTYWHYDEYLKCLCHMGFALLLGLVWVHQDLIDEINKKGGTQ